MSAAQLREQVNQVAAQQGWNQAQAEAAFREQMAQQASQQGFGQQMAETGLREQMAQQASQQGFQQALAGQGQAWHQGFAGQQWEQQQRQQYEPERVQPHDAAVADCSTGATWRRTRRIITASWRIQ